MGTFYNAATHLVRITNQGFSESKEKKTPFFFFEFTPIAEVRDGFNEQIDGKYSRNIKLYLTDKTVANVRKALADLGWEGESFRQIDPNVDGFHSFVGMETLAECSHESTGYEKWELPYERAASAPKESDAAISRKIDALFGKSKVPVGKSASKPAAKPSQTRETVPSGSGDVVDKNDEIPFAWLAILIPALSSFVC